MRSTLAILAAVSLAASQQAAPPAAKPQTGAATNAPAAAPAGQAQFVFKANSRLVVEQVTVVDKSGKPIEGLTAKDFTVTEDNVPQTVAYCEFNRMSDAVAAPTAPIIAATPTTPTPAPAPAVESVTANQITPETPGDARYRDKRLVAVYFDMSAMPVPDQLRALDYTEKFISTQMAANDLMSIMTYEGAGVKVKQDFTADKEKLRAAVETMVVGEDLGLGESTADAASSDYGSAFGQDDAEFNIFTTNRQLAALQTAVNMLAPLSEKKSFVYFASGLNLNGIDNQAQLTATTNAAIRAGVSFFPVDARGLVASSPLGDASQGSQGGISMYTGAAVTAGQDRMRRSQDTLYALASDTGGKAMFDSNNLAAGIVQAQNAITSYYIVSYYTSNPALDGKYRRVKVTYNGDPNAKLSYRVGYFTGKTFAKFTEADKERQLEDALMLGDPITDLTIDLELNYFQLNSAEYFIPIAAKIPGSELSLAKAGGAEKSVIDFIGEVKDEYGTTITNLRDQANLKLTGETAAQLAKSPIVFNAGVTVLPGNYSIKLLARDAETGRIGTYMTKFNIPNLTRVSDRLPMSSVVLSSQQVALTAALYNAKKDTAKDAEQASNPLVQNGIELIPSVTHVFSQKSQMYVYAQAYENDYPWKRGEPYPARTYIVPPTANGHVYEVSKPGVSGDTAPTFCTTANCEVTDGTVTWREAGVPAFRPLEAYVSFYRGTTKVFETPAQAVNTGIDPKSKAVPVTFNFPLAQLAPGKYVCQVTILDPDRQKSNYWQAPILVLP